MRSGWLAVVIWTGMILSTASAENYNESPSFKEGMEQRRLRQLQQIRETDAELNGLVNDNSAQALKRLGEILRFTSDTPPVMPEERLPVHEKAKEALIAKPGHATQYVEHLKRAKANAEANLKGEELPYPDTYFQYDLAKSVSFQTFGLMPTPETVGVLGDYLSDWEWPGSDQDPRERVLQSGELPPNCLLAAQVLGKLLEAPPVQKEPGLYSFDDVDVWQLWYEQVKSGKRTFKFKGDPKSYNLASLSAPSEAPPARPSKGLHVPASPLPEPVKPSSGSGTMIFIGLASLVLGAWAVRRFVRTRA